MKSKLVVNNLDLSDKVVQVTREKVSIDTGDGMHIPVFIEEQVTPAIDVNVTSEVEFDTYISWAIQSATPSWRIELDGVLYSEGSLQYADATQINDNTIQLKYGIWQTSVDAWNIMSKLVKFIPPLPEYFEIAGTLTVDCQDGVYEGQGIAAPETFVGFADNGDITQTTNRVGIMVRTTSKYIQVGMLAFSQFKDNSYFSLSQPVTQEFTFLIRKTASGWHVELSDGNTTISADGTGTINPEQFIVYYGELLQSGFPLNERVTSNVTIESITQL